MINKQKLYKKTLAVFATLFVTLTLVYISKPTNTTVSAQAYTDYQYFNLWGDASAEIRYVENGISDEFVASMPFSRLNTSQVFGASFVVYYDDTSTFVEYISPPMGTGVLYSAFTLNSYNFYIPQDAIHTLFGNNEEIGKSELILGEYLAQSIFLTITIDYLNSGLEQSHFENSATLTSTNAEVTLNDLIAPLNRNAFYTFNYNEVDYVLITRLTIKVEQAYYQGSGNALWDLNLHMFDFSSYGTYADYQNAQRVLASRSIDLYSRDFSIFKTIASSVNDLLSIEIFPNFSFLTLIALAITIPLTVWLLKAWLGG